MPGKKPETNPATPSPAKKSAALAQRRHGVGVIALAREDVLEHVEELLGEQGERDRYDARKQGEE